MAIIQEWSSLLTVFSRDVYDSWSLLPTAAVLALPCILKMWVPRHHASLIGYVMMLALGFSLPGLTFGQEPYAMTNRNMRTFQVGPSVHPSPVTQVQELSEATPDSQDSVKGKNRTASNFDPNDPASRRSLATFKERAELFEIKSKLENLCAKGLRLAQQVLAAPTRLPENEGLKEWEREMNFLVYTWFSEEQRAEWFSAGKEIVDYVDTHAERLREAPDNQDKLELVNRLFALLMSARVDALEKLANDLGARINAIKAPRSSD